MNILAIVIGLFLFAFQIRLPAVIRSAFAMAGNTMGPVAMLIIGMLMADMDMQHLRSYRQLWKPVLLRLIVLPVILVCVAKYSGLAALGSSRRNTDHHQSALCDRALRQHCDPVQSDVQSGRPLCQSDQYSDHAALHHHDAADDYPVSDVTAQKIATGFIRLSPFFT